MKKLLASAGLLIATILWGTAFSAQSAGMSHLSPAVFLALRSFVGVLALIVIIMLFDYCRDRKISFWGRTGSAADRRKLLRGGFWCGLVITAASLCQQYGLVDVTAGKTGFLTTLYIIIVPVIGIFIKRKINILIWIATFAGLAGAYLLCGGVSGINLGEWLVIACAFIFALHILVIDHYAPECDCIRLSCIQFITAAIVSAVLSFILRDPWPPEAVKNSMPFWIFCGVGSSAVAFTLQIAAQKYLHPVTATLLMSLESVFAALSGWLFLNEYLSGRELAGCAVIFAAVIISQLPVPSPVNSGSKSCH